MHDSANHQNGGDDAIAPAGATSMHCSRRHFLSRSAVAGIGIAAARPLVPIDLARDVRPHGAPPAEITHRSIRTNGISMHIAEAGRGFPVVMLHGFPELWYSWRHQLPALAAAGFHAVAPDLRGYGDTDVPADVARYSMKELTADVAGLLDALGAERCVLVGHDWGANVAWAFAELYPSRVAALVALSVPYHRRSAEPPTVGIAKFSGEHFNFFSYFQAPGVAERELERDVRDSLRRFFHALSGEAPSGLVRYLFTQKPGGAGALDGMPEPPRLPPWLSEHDLDVYAAAFRRTGFGGALAWYRNADRNWRELPRLGASTLPQPTLFMGGRKDPAVVFGQFDPMIAAVPELRRIVFLPGCGHWVQQERADEVNAELIAFARSAAVDRRE